MRQGFWANNEMMRKRDAGLRPTYPAARMVPAGFPGHECFRWSYPKI